MLHYIFFLQFPDKKIDQELFEKDEKIIIISKYVFTETNR